MRDFKVTHNTVTADLKIGQSLNNIKAAFKPYETQNTYFDDAELNRQYLSYYDIGLEFVFQKEKLGTVYVYIKEEHYLPFTGTLGVLKSSFFKTPTIENFYKDTINDGFVQWFKEYPNGPLMVKNSTRLTYNNNPKIGRKAIVYFGCEPHMARLPNPFEPNELLTTMLSQYTNISKRNAIKPISNIEYESNCRKLLMQIETGLSKTG